MPEGNEEKTEEPTAKRRQKFREEGNIPQSRDIGGTAIMSAVLLYVVYQGGTIYRALDRTVVLSFQALPEAAGRNASGTMMWVTKQAGLGYVRAFSVIAGLTVLLGLAAGFIQTGGNFTMKVFEFKTEKFILITYGRMSI